MYLVRGLIAIIFLLQLGNAIASPVTFKYAGVDSGEVSAYCWGGCTQGVPSNGQSVMNGSFTVDLSIEPFYTVAQGPTPVLTLEHETAFYDGSGFKYGSFSWSKNDGSYSPTPDSSGFSLTAFKDTSSYDQIYIDVTDVYGTSDPHGTNTRRLHLQLSFTHGIFEWLGNPVLPFTSLDKWFVGGSYTYWDAIDSSTLQFIEYRYHGDLTSLEISAVPVPAAAWLLGSGLLGLVGIARRKAA